MGVKDVASVKVDSTFHDFLLLAMTSEKTEGEVQNCSHLRLRSSPLICPKGFPKRRQRSRGGVGDIPIVSKEACNKGVAVTDSTLLRSSAACEDGDSRELSDGFS